MKSLKYLAAPAIAGALSLSISPAMAGAPGTPSVEEMWRLIQQQQREIKVLKSQLQQTDQKAEVAVETAEKAVDTKPTKAAWAERTRVGGYGELHYNNLDGEGGAKDKDELDFHRFVLFFGHDFNDKVRFHSELELEHALVEDTDDGSGPGEVELEQAYIEFDLNDTHRARAGIFLIPAGILNETHEPNTFYGVERNPVEKDIIPSTWWAGGAALQGELAPGWSYDVAVHEGLNTSAGSNYAIRKGRQKTAKAKASDLAVTGRVKWTGRPGMELAGTVQHQGDITQGSDPTAGSATLFEAHGIFNRGPFGLRALYAHWDLDGTGPAGVGADEQSGWYVEPSFKVNEKLGLFARYNQWDNQAGDSVGSEKTQWDIGMNWWPHPDVVIKADYQSQDHDSGKNQDGFNVGVGYQF